MKTYTIGNSAKIPALGLGTWKSAKGKVGKAVENALEIGYTHFDCAHVYMNEEEIGQAFRRQKLSGSKRESAWVTSKLWNNAHRARHVKPALEKTLKDLQLDYLDLYLIHWPVHFKHEAFFPQSPDDYLPPEEIPVMETWQAMQKLVDSGMCRFIGVCNFNIAKLHQLEKEADIKPVVNQIELHPYLQQQEMLEYCRNNDMLLTAYSPLGSGDRSQNMKKEDEPSLLENAVIKEIAAAKGVTCGQILLAWALDRGTVTIPKSVNPEHQQQNLEAAQIQLDDGDREAIKALDKGYRYVDGRFFTSQGSPYTMGYLWQEK